MTVLTSKYLLSLQCDTSRYTECSLASWILKIVPFILVFVGVTGNVLNLIVLSLRKFQKKYTCVFLRFLAVTDISLLCSSPLLHALKHAFDVDMWTLSSFSCSLSEWIVFTSGLNSCWFIVLVTAERTFLTLYPTTAKLKMTPRNSTILSISVILLVSLLNGHLIYGNTIMERQVIVTVNNGTRIKTMKSCSLRHGKYLEFHEHIWSKVLLIFGSILPIILIVLGNVIVATSLTKRSRALRRIQHSDERVSDRNPQLSQRTDSNNKLFFVLCSVYIVTTLSYGLFATHLQFIKVVDEHTLAKYHLWAVMMRFLLWSNFSFNFFLYFMTGSLFRAEVRKLFSKHVNRFHR